MNLTFAANDTNKANAVSFDLIRPAIAANNLTVRQNH
jgi:hypothetical protein